MREMADSLVDSIVTFALENLSRVLVDEVKLLSGVEGKISSLRNELRFMHVFIKNSEGKHNNDIVKEVVSQIRDVAHQAEDVVDTYIAKVKNKRTSMNKFEKCFNCRDHVFMVHELDDQMNEIKNRINEIYSNKARYGIEEGDFNRRDQHNTMEEYARSLHRRRRDVEEEEVAGLVHESTSVIKKLKEENSRRSVISIIGMGGLGKTTLARKIYNNRDDLSHPCRAWGNVSNDYTPKELLLSLLRCLNPSEEQLKECKDLSVEQLKEKVRHCLEGKKYLVVLDDVWEIEVWDELKGAFPNNSNGSSILITSRNKEVASYSNSITYDLPFLSEKDSWHLFCKKVFEDEACPGDLEGLGREMVKGCKGLPLSIVVLAGLVAKKKKSKGEWEQITKYINWHIAQDNIAMEILKLSYNYLPRELKPCFLSLGIYPEDYEIPATQLIECWIGEGFIQPTDFGTSDVPELEEVAKWYLDELVDRSMVQVASKKSHGGVKTCQIHDLLRDLCISESKANKFMEVGIKLDIKKCSSRRLSLHYKTEFSPTEYSQLHSHSLFLFGDKLKWDNESKGWKWIRKNLKLVRVLDLGKVSFVSAPHGLKTLIHLRNLRIEAKNSKIGNNILTSICNLWNLETLHLLLPRSKEYDVTIPSGMWKLKRLRHVHVSRACMVTGENSETAVSLQTLGGMGLRPALALMMNNGFFPNLTKLILYADRISSPQQFSSLHYLDKLRKLTLLPDKFNLPLDANVFPPNLTKITLTYFRDGLAPRFMNTLGQVGSLKVLKLKTGKLVGSINCVVGEFPQLEVFHMKDITIQGQWRQEQGAMPHLQRLIFYNCDYWDEQEKRLKPYADCSTEFSKIQLNSDCNVIVEHSFS